MNISYPDFAGASRDPESRSGRNCLELSASRSWTDLPLERIHELVETREVATHQMGGVLAYRLSRWRAVNFAQTRAAFALHSQKLPAVGQADDNG
jgi:hypothetical protein